MDHSLIIIIIVLFGVVLLLFKNGSEEHLDPTTSGTAKNPNGTGVSLTAFLEDDLFSDVKVYENDGMIADVDKLGIEKCVADPRCETCVEFGPTGKAFCYPHRDIPPKMFKD